MPARVIALSFTPLPAATGKSARRQLRERYRWSVFVPEEDSQRLSLWSPGFAARARSSSGSAHPRGFHLRTSALRENRA